MANNGKRGKSSGQKESELTPSIRNEVQNFVDHIDGLAAALPILMLMADALRLVRGEGLVDFFETFGKVASEDGTEKRYEIGPLHIREAARLASRFNQAQASFTILPRSFLVALVSQFDFLLSRLLRCLYYLQPGLLNAAEKQIPLSQLLAFQSIDEAKEYALEKEIESVLRMSHLEQFVWLEKRFDIDLRKGLPAWKIFIELILLCELRKLLGINGLRLATTASLI